MEQIDQKRWIVGDDVVDSQIDQGRHLPGVVDGPDMNLSARVALTNFMGRLPLPDFVILISQQDDKGSQLQLPLRPGCPTCQM